MNHKKYLYSSGEFAKFTGINKRTLHYYNEIGLFCPEVIGENGYHYYTCFQFAQLELILTLRKIGLSLDEIREYVTTPSDESFSQMMIKKKKLSDVHFPNGNLCSLHQSPEIMMKKISLLRQSFLSASKLFFIFMTILEVESRWNKLKKNVFTATILFSLTAHIVQRHMT